ncbi:hypothetical protein XTPLMG728_2980 [Xanthomonas translucens pv. poae]|uniref:Uncharacterized protein n=1 Tax=Xanthomonas graminis pv. poae TaxID=227946 RepID=A0A0K3A312_9XANT|nr:hypothetical protein XTPLMG728_2980 [Xanthomonas translucens pv. poae]
MSNWTGCAADRRLRCAPPYRHCSVRWSRWCGVRRCRRGVPGTSVSFAVIRVAMLRRPRWMRRAWLATWCRGTCGSAELAWHRHRGASVHAMGLDRSLRSGCDGTLVLSIFLSPGGGRRRDRRRRMAAATQGKRPQGVACISSARCRAYGQARQRSCAAGCRRGGRGAPAILPRLQRYLSNSCWRTATTQVSSVSRCSSALLSLGLPEPRSSMVT